MSKIRRAENPFPEDGIKHYSFYCPGCKHSHGFETPRWKFNGNMDKPTIRPSLLIKLEATSRPQAWPYMP